ncbi:MAG: gamma-glutamyl-gamma-aminobutyrate hydrolase family protein [Synergistaceae bacterium]|jgi:putative glutamine amidotransferase|nr:gamma-glutamyl-gamma-aminobutyrate hydrolase family protein [Synergistaceae bacterium]
MQPLIGITSYFLNTRDKDNKPLERYLSPNVYVSYPTYVHRVERAGGIPIDIPYYLDDASVFALAEKLDGILFCGGEDVNPQYYGEPVAGTKTVVPERDALEFKLLDAFFKLRKPIFGICRGEQVINTFFKGSLIQDIARENKGYIEHSRSDNPDSPVHKIAVKTGTRLHSILGETTVNVNSLHHQAARTPGEGLVVSARSEDGLVEGLELPDYPFLLGVQWHPERLDIPPHFALFEEFIRSSRRSS